MPPLPPDMAFHRQPHQKPNGAAEVKQLPQSVTIKIEEDEDTNDRRGFGTKPSRLSMGSSSLKLDQSSKEQFPDTINSNHTVRHSNLLSTPIDDPMQANIIATAAHGCGGSEQGFQASRGRDTGPVQANMARSQWYQGRMTRNMTQQAGYTKALEKEVARVSELLKRTVADKLASEKLRKESEMEVHRLKKAIDEMTDENFRSLPTAQISDSQIGEEYHLLCSQIEDWIDTEFPNLEGCFDAIEWQLVTEDRFKALGGDSYVNSVEFDAIWKYPGADYSILRRMIQRCLDIGIFDRKSYFVALADDGKVLENVENGMRSLEPRMGKLNEELFPLSPPNSIADEQTIETWRSNALRALSARPEYQHHLENYLREYSGFVHQFLERLFPRDRDTQKAMESFHANITIPAAKLASNMRLFSQSYFLDKSTQERGNNGNRILKKDLKRCTLVDVKTDQAVVAARFRQLGDSDKIGKEVFIIHPSLVRKGRGNAPNLVVRHPVILVRLDGD